jgi:hypothetical protein
MINLKVPYGMTNTDKVMHVLAQISGDVDAAALNAVTAIAQVYATLAVADSIDALREKMSHDE